MEDKVVRQRVKQIIMVIIIVLLLPYVITIFMNGSSIETNGTIDDVYLKVKKEKKIIKIPLQEYCIGVLAKEIKPNYKEQALQAQAVIVRTSIYRQIEEKGKKLVCEEAYWTQQEMLDKWGTVKFNIYYNKLQDAWNETEGEVIVYDDKLIVAPFHQLNNGSTRNGNEVLCSKEYPYLQMKESTLDLESKEQMKITELGKLDKYPSAEVLESDSAGYVKRVKVGETIYTGEEFRDIHQLVSSCFTFQEYNGKLRVVTKGVGHGLGMSQYSANEMAKDGKSHTEILQYYFDAIQIKEVAEILLNIE